MGYFLDIVAIREKQSQFYFGHTPKAVCWQLLPRHGNALHSKYVQLWLQVKAASLFQPIRYFFHGSWNVDGGNIQAEDWQR